jgi:phosphocarrier protein
MAFQQISQIVKVKNIFGLHTRPATTIARLLQRRRSSVTFTYKKTTVNAKSIMGLLLLAAPHNAKITISVEGDDAEDTLADLIAEFENCFGDKFGEKSDAR